MGERKMITRVGYERKGYYRRSYKRSDGTLVKGTRIQRTYVPAARIPGRGMAARTGHKGRKLIPMKDYRHLRTYGYSLSSSSANRHKALDRAIRSRGHLWPLHRLVALSTLYKNAEPRLSRKTKSDVRYIQKIIRSQSKHRHLR